MENNCGHDTANYCHFKIKKHGINWQNDRGESLLHIAVKNEDIHFIAILIAKGINQDLLDSYDNTPIYYANTETKRFIDFLNDNSCDNWIDDYIKAIVEKSGINVIRESESLLHYTVRHDLYHIVEYLISQGIDQNIKNSYEKTAYEIASKPMKVFIDYINCTANNDWIDSDDSEFIDYMLANGANINAEDCDGNTLLHKETNIARINHYITMGANIEAKNKFGNTPFNGRVNSIEKFKALAEAGANINTENNLKENILDRVLDEWKFSALIDIGCVPKIESVCRIVNKIIFKRKISDYDLSVLAKLANFHKERMFIGVEYFNEVRIALFISLGFKVANIRHRHKYIIRAMLDMPMNDNIKNWIMEAI